MEQRDIDELDKARREILEAQRECAWCGFVATSAAELVAHITETHPE